MCLQKIEDFNVKSRNGVGFGWKIFTEYNGELSGEYYCSKKRPINRWIKEGDFRSGCFTNKRFKKIESRYPFGWHIYATYKDARNYAGHARSWCKIKKVKFRDVVATGYQASRKIIIAKEMLIIK